MQNKVHFAIHGQTAAGLAKAHAEQGFAKFRVLDDQRFESDFDLMVKIAARQRCGEEAQATNKPAGGFAIDGLTVCYRSF